MTKIFHAIIIIVENITSCIQYNKNIINCLNILLTHVVLIEYFVLYCSYSNDINRMFVSESDDL